MLVRTLTALATAWLLLLVAAPLIPAPAAALVYAAGSVICHQRPERSFYLAASQLPVCARCLGIYSGVAAAALWLLFAPGARRLMPARASGARWLVALAAIPTVVTLLLEWGGVWQPFNLARALAGAPLGFAVASVLLHAASPSSRSGDTRTGAAVH